MQFHAETRDAHASNTFPYMESCHSMNETISFHECFVGFGFLTSCFSLSNYQNESDKILTIESSLQQLHWNKTYVIMLTSLIEYAVKFSMLHSFMQANFSLTWKFQAPYMKKVCKTSKQFIKSSKRIIARWKCSKQVTDFCKNWRKILCWVLTKNKFIEYEPFTMKTLVLNSGAINLESRKSSDALIHEHEPVLLSNLLTFALPKWVWNLCSLKKQYQTSQKR